MSGFICPIIITLLDSFIRFSKACATTLAFTFVLFSTSWALPPKNLYISFCLITAWSPPLPRTMSIAVCADLYLSLSFFPSLDIAMLNVNWTFCFGSISLILSNILNLSSFIFSKYLCSKMYIYLSLSDFINTPFVSFVHSYIFLSISATYCAFSSLSSICMFSS